MDEVRLLSKHTSKLNLVDALDLATNTPDAKAAPKPRKDKEMDQNDEDCDPFLVHGDQRDMVHYLYFGRRGFVQINKATFMSWNRKPFQNPRTIPWEIPLSTAHLLRLLHGFVPVEMEDKWFIYADGPYASGTATVNFHSSWTGDKVAELTVEIQWGGDCAMETWSGKIVSLTIEEDVSEVPQGETGEDFAKYQVLEACNWILGIKVVDEINEPVYWKETLSKLSNSDLPRKTGNTYRGIPAISKETQEDIWRLGGLEGLTTII